MATGSLLLAHDHDSIDVLDELVRESLRALLPVTLVASWVGVTAIMLVVEPRVGQAFKVFAVLLGAVLGSYGLQRKRLDLAVGVYLAGVSLAIVIIALAFRETAALYFLTLILPITATLTSQRAMWPVAAGVGGLMMGIGIEGHMRAAGLVLPLVFLGLTAIALWLSSRRLYTALGWALSMTAESRKNAEDARERRAEVRSILKSLEEAYARLERANEALIVAREAADRAYRFKAEFVANVSHELRTPLNLIVGFSEMMATAPESYRGTLLPSEYRGDVTAIYRSARHLSDLINDVLDLSQIEAGRLPLSREPADLGEVVREAVEMVRGLAEAKGLQLELDLPEVLSVLRLDRTRIRQVLLNLLTNATRFTDSGWIRVRAVVEGQEVRVTVEDSGRGIPSDKLAQAFQAFGQLDEDLARRGAGLGLALSKSFVELHGGTIAIESTLGRGTRVAFSLPLPDGGSDQPLILLKSAPVPSQQGWPRVLVLHDDPHTQSLLRRYIEGYQFVLADSVAKAVDLIAEAPPAAVMVEAGWAERWAEVAATASLPPHLPVLTCPLPSLRRFGLLLGAGDYLAKPIAREDLAAALGRLPKPPRTVLVVDDDRHLLRLLARLLVAGDPTLHVLEASGGKEGLGLARAQRPDLILLDLLMPEVSGYDFLEEIGCDGALAGTPVIIMSARSIEQEAAPVMGELRVGRPAGFSLTEILQSTQALLTALTQPAAVARASGLAQPGGHPG